MNAMSHTVRRVRRALVAVAAASAIAACTGLALAGTAQASTVLTPDPDAYCAINPPFGQQVQVDGWQVNYDQLLGDTYQNDWRCQYLVSASVPTASKAQSFVLPPFHWSTAIDWNAMCNQQYPGSWATWIPAPETGVYGAPWGCQAPTGVSYDSAENSYGIHAVISG
jgi:hypothetical protein